MAGRYGSLDYPKRTRFGFGLGIALFVAGVAGAAVLPAVTGPLPAWERALFFDMEALGVALALVSPFVFGVLLPLTE